MVIPFIIALVIFIAAVVIIIKITKTIAKAILYISSLLFIIIAVFGILIYIDGKNFQDDFPTTQSLYLLEYPDSNIAAGVQGLIEGELGKDILLVKKDELSLYQSSFQKK